MRLALWPEGSRAEHEREIEEFFAGESREPLAVLIATDRNGRPLGMAELSIRNIAEGCGSGRIAYLEGWFVVPEARRQGVGRALMRAVEDWGRAQGCVELASDTTSDNVASMDAHRALGFEDVGMIRCFRKDL
jgi:aminoglycoside 6'-N-acetyltransferase I